MLKLKSSIGKNESSFFEKKFWFKAAKTANSIEVQTFLGFELLMNYTKIWKDFFLKKFELGWLEPMKEVVLLNFFRKKL